MNTKQLSKQSDGAQAILQSLHQEEERLIGIYVFFSTNTLSQSHSIDTGKFVFKLGSQICNLMYSKISNEMITTHGYSLNQINLWSSTNNWEPKSVNKVSTLTGHTYRVLYLAASPSGESILTGAGDETLRFWNVFDGSHYKKNGPLILQMDLR
eukprot:GHVR01036315.1.p1 GENE.GHVR01036315.1~~GHVR01036315.1.p1  ORF type:complete len:154 (-),score=1.55 GHVR01036315.1:96-557(-)